MHWVAPSAACQADCLHTASCSIGAVRMESCSPTERYQAHRLLLCHVWRGLVRLGWVIRCGFDFAVLPVFWAGHG